MSAPTQTSVPASIIAGDTATWLLTLADYPASAGWSVTYTLINAAGKITIPSTASGSDHLINVAPATTSAYAVGKYSWQCRVSGGGQAFTVAVGEMEVKANFAAATTLDSRSHAQKLLDAIEAWIENRDLAVSEYEIAGRRMKYIPMGDLLKLRDQYRREVQAAMGNSGARSGRVYVRF